MIPASLFVLFALSRLDKAPSCHRTVSLETPVCPPPRQTAATSFTSSSNKYNDLLEWLKEQNAFVSDKIFIDESSRGGGYGAFVSEAVSKDELLFCIPRKLCLTLDDVTGDAECGEAFQNIMEKAGPGGNTVCMAGYLAKQYLIGQEEQQQGDASTNTAAESFGPYLATLPWNRGINNQEHVLFWTDEEVESLLKGTLCYEESTALRSEVALASKVMNRVVGPSIRAARGEDTSPKGGFSWPWEMKSQKSSSEMVDGLPEAMTGAFVCLLTRSFQDGEDEKLVPMLDMLQHSDEPNVGHVMRKVDGAVEVKAKRDIAAGEELLNQYRSEEEETMPYHRFFSRFGFVPGIVEPIRNLLEDRSSIFYPQKAEI